MRDRGFTLVELLIALAIAGILATAALPSFDAQLRKSRRTDGIAALMQLELAQARYRANHGAYSADLRALGLGGGSLDGHYRIAIASAGPSAYRASAEALPDSPQAKDGDCAPLTLAVSNDNATRGPTRACWNR